MKLERLLAIAMLLANRRRVQAQELADRFEVSVRTIYRDIEAINQAGIPVVTYQGAGGGIGIADGYRIDRHFLTRDELASVFIALKGAATYQDHRAEAVLEKMRGTIPESRAMTEHIIVDLSPWGSNAALQAALATLKDAIGDRRRVSFAYFGAAGETTRREVEPYTLLLKGQNWYLYAFCRLRQGFRLFKLGRMKEIEPLETRFERVAINLEESPWEKEWFTPAKMVELTLRFDDRVRGRAEEWFDAGALTRDETGRWVGRIAFPEDDWVYGFILSFGPGIEVLEPAYVRERILQMARGIAALYSEG